MDRKFWELDEDPEAALDVILGKARGDKQFAVVCLAQAIQNGRYPREGKQ